MSDKKEDSLHVKWIDKPGQKGELLFSFDGQQIFNLFRDYPYALTPEQKQIFDSENPFWSHFFRDRKYEENRNRSYDE